jgi:hypothetical protein
VAAPPELTEREQLVWPAVMNQNVLENTLSKCALWATTKYSGSSSTARRSDGIGSPAFHSCTGKQSIA